MRFPKTSLQAMQAAAKLRHSQVPVVMPQKKITPPVEAKKPATIKKYMSMVKAQSPPPNKTRLREPKVMPDPPQTGFKRPKAEYTNIPSPYGIATQMLWEQLKKSG